MDAKNASQKLICLTSNYKINTRKNIYSGVKTKIINFVYVENYKKFKVSDKQKLW